VITSQYYINSVLLGYTDVRMLRS